ncbi:hypothetical protein JTE90_005508 [Oedothorax gibbosus]|uniref:Uncharacterized protein n=1 Tax=Oedothorax gibbosus TaxID=931172 RepID=A0AAV6UTH5_9ARAC|nr:hypothetical protein JTE90_005508 [Oedothorax gibbosus]
MEQAPNFEGNWNYFCIPAPRARQKTSPNSSKTHNRNRNRPTGVLSAGKMTTQMPPVTIGAYLPILTENSVDKIRCEVSHINYFFENTVKNKSSKISIRLNFL